MSIVRRALTAALTAFALVLLGWGAAPLAHAADPVTVTGSVVDAGSNPLAEVDVSLCLLSDGDVDCGEASATTSPTGEFTFDMANLAEGRTYTIRFSRASFFTTWLGGTTEQPTTPTPANSVGRSATSVHLEPLTLAQQFTLKGTLRTQSDLPIADVLVGLFPDDSDLSGGAALAGDNTNADGSFSIQIPADADTTDYVLATNDEEGVFAQHKETVTLSQADKDLGTIVLAGSLSVASGTVTDLGGNPIPDVSVTSMIWDGDSFSGYGYTSTGADGSYTVKVKAGKRFTVRYDQSKFSTEYLGGGHTRPTQEEDPVATRLAAPVDEPNAPLPTIVLDRMWQVSGRLVVVSAGDGVDNASVAAYAPNHSAGDESVDTASSDSNGDFSLSLPPGSYDLVIQTDEANPAVAGTTLAAVQVGDDTDLGEVALTALGNPVTGRITSASGPVAGARITSYLWSPDNSEWTSGVSAFSGADGTYVLPVKDGATFTVRARGNGFQTGWLGSGLVKPSEPEPNASAVSAPGLSIGDLNLFPTSDKVGKVAGQDLGYCSAHTLRANDDQSTGQVRLPFALKYFGQPYSSLFVNNNGNVTFGRPLSKYTPGDLTSADQDAPMIAPFFADVDTRNDASWEVTYGASADGKTFCVNWSTVGYFGRKADKLNIFQLLLSTRSSSVGRTDGDFDITMNYDQIQWETGDASDGTGGEGGTSAAVGYTAGTGDVGTFFELAGSRLPGSFLDQGPTALVSHQLNSSQVGRYLFQIRNQDATVLLGGLKGSLVKAGSGQPVADAALTACRIVNDVKTRCQLTKSGVNGAFSFPVSPVGDYTVEVSPPGSLRATTLRGVVTAGETTDLGVTSLVEPTPIPAGTHLTSIETVNGIPVVYYAEPLTLSIPSPCVAGAAPAGNWRVLDGVGETLRSGALSVVGAVLTGSIPQLYPYSGAGRIETVVTCSGAPSASPSFDIYIDPSGTVYDEYGIPVTGVSVTLERSDNSDGPFVAVPDGSTLMSPANRTNPVITGPDGRFHWDVSAGWYRLVLAKSGCSSQTGAAMNIPPARVDLVTKLHCAAPAPSRALAISGSPTLGAVLTAVSADFGLPSAGFRWLRGGDQLGTGASHTVTEADLGHQLTVEQSFQAAAVTTTEGTQVTFAALTTRASVDAPLRTLTRTPAPTVSGKAKAGSKLKAKVDAWGPAPVALTYAWLRSGTVIPGATAATYKVQPRDGGSRITVRVTGSKATYAAVSRYSAPTKVVPLSKLKAAAVKIKGTPKVGRTLTAATGRWTAGTSFAFQWLRAGKVVRGATGATFTLTAADRGKTIKVRVTGTKQGYKTVAKTSKATKKVK